LREILWRNPEDFLLYGNYDGISISKMLC